MRRSGIGNAIVILEAVGIVVLLLATSGSVLPSVSDSAGTDSPRAPHGNLSRTTSPPADPSFTVSGTVTGIGPVGASAPLAGVLVSAYNQSLCGDIVGPSTCGTPVATASSAADGNYSVSLPDGVYYLASARGEAGGTAYGGTAVAESVSGANVSGVSLAGWPYVPYGNATLVLPGFNCMSAYLWQVPSSKSGNSEQCQNPIVSWTQDGFFYVNITDHLVFYSAENGTVEDFGAWTPLYTNFANYVMVQNEEFVTQDSSYIYGWGTSSPTSSKLEFEAVNLTTKQHFEHTFIGVTTEDVTVNGQVQMTGFDGNDSLVTLIDSKGTVYTYNLWNGTEWKGTTLPYFEANNVYWVPYFNGYVDIRANGSAGHELSEWQLSGDRGTLSETFDSLFSAVGNVNGVNGWAYNLTSHTFYFSVEDDHLTQDAFSVNASGGTLLTEVSSRSYVEPADAVGDGDGSFAQQSDQARGTLVSDGDVFQGDSMGFDNDSWIQNPSTFEYESTNVTPLTHYWAAGAMSTGTSWDADSMFFNTSYLYSEASIDCSSGEKTGVPGLCSIQGKGGAVPGTVYWFWRLGLPEFPFATTNSVAQPDAPLPTATTLATVNATTVRVTWYPSTGEPQPIVNWTLVWQAKGGSPHYASQWGQNRSATIAGLGTGENLSWCVEAWNLHWHGPCLEQTETLGGPAFPPPGNLTLDAVGASWFIVNWTNPSVPVDRDTAYLAPYVQGTCGEFSVEPSTGPSTFTTYNYTGLNPVTEYCVAVGDENATGVSPPSAPLIVETLSGLPIPPGRPTFPYLTGTSVFVSWRQASFPDGLPNNDTVLAGTTCSDRTIRASTHGPATSLDVTGLEPNTEYCVAIEAWLGTGPSSQTLTGPDANVTTLTVPVSPTAPTFRNLTDHSAVVVWTQGSFPGGVIGNDTILLGTRCGVWTRNVSTGGPASSAEIASLNASTRYCVAVEAWNGTSGTLGNLTGPSAWVTTLAVPHSAPWNPSVVVPAILVAASASGALVAVVAYRRRRAADPPRP